MRRCLLAALALLTLMASQARPDIVEDTLRTHLAAIGGRDRLEAMTTMKATGRTKTPGGESTFTLWATRPASIRVETVSKDRTLIQVYNGKGRPFEHDSARPDLGWHTMAFENGSRFIADSDFDDPLIEALDGRLNADNAGFQNESDGQRLKLLMTRPSEPAFWILVDPETYLITGRIDVRTNPIGGKLDIVTTYDDFRLDGGLLTPHHLIVKEGSVTIQETFIDTVVANAALPPNAFEPPPADASPKAP